jgi:predicted GTPase
MITNNAIKIVNSCQLIVLVLDAFSCFEKRETDLIHYCLKEGRGLIVMVNKFDLLEEKWH